jgi:hypothetical protein
MVGWWVLVHRSASFLCKYSLLKFAEVLSKAIHDMDL